MKIDWKKGDWCFCNFELQQIEDVDVYVDGNAITEVSDGHMRHFGKFLNDTCYPLDIRIKLISGTFKYYSNLLHKVDDLEFKRGFPDIHREIVKRWCECCNDKDDTEKIQEHYNSLEEWYYNVTDNKKGLRKIKLEKLEK